jgi:hypothetical protein
MLIKQFKKFSKFYMGNKIEEFHADFKSFEKIFKNVPKKLLAKM